MVSIPACHAGDRGSIPRRGGIGFYLVFFVNCFFVNCLNENKTVQQMRITRPQQNK